MTTEQIQAVIIEKQQRMVLLENEATALEQQARDKRAERMTIKGELADLNTSLVQVSTMNAAQQAMQAAQTNAAASRAELQQLQAARAETEALNAQLRERLETLAAAKPADAAPAA